MFQDLKEKFESIEKEVEQSAVPQLEELEKIETKVKKVKESFASTTEQQQEEAIVEEVVVWRKAPSKFQKPVRVESFSLQGIQKRFEGNVNVLNKNAKLTYEYQIAVPSAGMVEQFEEITDLIYENKSILCSTPQLRYRIRVYQEKSGNLAFSIFMNLLPREVKARDSLLRELFKTKCRIEAANRKCKILHNHRLIERSTIFGLQINQKIVKTKPARHEAEL